jgi:hypothetical protein
VIYDAARKMLAEGAPHEDVVEALQQGFHLTFRSAENVVSDVEAGPEKTIAATSTPIPVGSASELARRLLRDDFPAPVVIGELTKIGVHVDKAIQIVNEARHAELLGAR